MCGSSCAAGGSGGGPDLIRNVKNLFAIAVCAICLMRAGEHCGRDLCFGIVPCGGLLLGLWVLLLLLVVWSWIGSSVVLWTMAATLDGRSAEECRLNAENGCR